LHKGKGEREQGACDEERGATVAAIAVDALLSVLAAVGAYDLCSTGKWRFLTAITLFLSRRRRRDNEKEEGQRWK
jgi:hypothetical protein